MIERGSTKTSLSVYGLLALAVLGLALAGYAAFVLYARSGLSATTGSGLFALAVAAGTASFFSPCSFGLLVTLLAREVGDESSSPDDRPAGGRVLLFAGGIAAGAAAFLLLVGLGVAAGGSALFRNVTFTSTPGRVIRGVVGTLLALLGLVQLNVFRLPALFDTVAHLGTQIRREQAKLRRRRPLLGFTLFGFGYLLAGFG